MHIAISSTRSAELLPLPPGPTVAVMMPLLIVAAVEPLARRELARVEAPERYGLDRDLVRLA